MAVGPCDTGSGVVVVNGSRGRHIGVEKVEFFEDVSEVGKKFDAFVCGIDFGFSGAAGSNGLATRGPVDGFVHPDEEAR